jgi:transmembrane sensor
MDDEIELALLERYLAGECTPAERERIEVWLAADPARHSYAESLRTIGKTWREARPQFDSKAAWAQLTDRLASEASPERQPDKRPSHEWGRGLGLSPRRTLTRWIAVAGVAAAAVAAVVIGTRGRPVQTAPVPATREYVTAAAQQMTLRLSDGTRVWLAPQSRLVLDGDYGHSTRSLQVVGQAYFEVTHDSARPFRVRAGKAVAWDLGTRFTVRAYPGERVRVAVAEGSVALPQALPAPLLAGDLATVDSAGRGTVAHGVDLARFTAWTKGTLQFRDTPLAEAAADLARWYGIDVRLGDPGLARCHITVSLAESSIDAALDLVAPAVGARYERRGRSVVLYSLPTP